MLLFTSAGFSLPPLTGSPRIHFKLILKAKCETNCIVTGEKCKWEKTARAFLPMPSSFQKKVSVKCLKTQPCAFNCLDVFFLLLLIIISWCIWYCNCSPNYNRSLHHFFLHTSNPIERLLFLSHFFGLSTGSISDLAFVPKDQTWVVDEQTQVYVLTELIIWQLFLVLPSSCLAQFILVGKLINLTS